MVPQRLRRRLLLGSSSGSGVAGRGEKETPHPSLPLPRLLPDPRLERGREESKGAPSPPHPPLPRATGGERLTLPPTPLCPLGGCSGSE